MVLFLRRLTSLDKEYSFVGIGGVVTHHKYRHRGYSTQLLQASLKKVLEDCDFALLCTDIEKLTPLYGGVGFIPLGRPYCFMDKNGLKKPETGGMIAPLSSPEAVKHILSTDNELFVGTSNF